MNVIGFIRDERGGLGLGWGNIGFCWQSTGTPVTAWILATGFWNDLGAWDDTASWID